MNYSTRKVEKTGRKLTTSYLEPIPETGNFMLFDCGVGFLFFQDWILGRAIR